MPDFPIIDTHVHLYDIARLRYGWLDGVPKINRTHLIPEFDAARGGVEIDRLIFVEVCTNPDQHLEEVAFIEELAARDPRIAAIVAHAPVEKGAAVEADLDQLLQFPHVRGIRRLIQGEVDPSICITPAFIEGVCRLARHNLTFDICIRHWALVYAIELVRKCPEVTFILDHIGKPDIGHGLREPWWSQMRELARMPNVVCKLSGAIGEADPAQWTVDAIKPYVTHAIECFGFNRCLYGSDWPVSALTHRYCQWVEVLDEVIAGATPAEKHALYCGTAELVYRL